MDMPAQIDMGMEALELSFTLAEYDPDVLRLFGLHDQNAVRLTARGALQRNGEAAVAIVINATGHIKEFDPGSFEAGALPRLRSPWAFGTIGWSLTAASFTRSTSKT